MKKTIFTALLASLIFVANLGAQVEADTETSWRGQWKSMMSSRSGRVTMKFNQDGSRLSGRASLTNTVCGDVSFNLSGSIRNGYVAIHGSIPCDDDDDDRDIVRIRGWKKGAEFIAGTYGIRDRDDDDDDNDDDWDDFGPIKLNKR